MSELIQVTMSKDGPEIQVDLVRLTEKVAHETGIKRGSVYKVLITAFDSLDDLGLELRYKLND